MVRLMRCGQIIKQIRPNKHLHQMCPLCQTTYDKGRHRPCIDICKGEKCLSCIINLKKCAKCPPEFKSCQPSPSSSLRLLVKTTLEYSSVAPKLEVNVEVGAPLPTPSSSSKLQEDMVVIPKLETATVPVKELKDEGPPIPPPQQQQPPKKKLIGYRLGKDFPENVRYIPGKDRRNYYCTICSSRWTTKQNKKAHDHGKPKPFMCNLCPSTKGNPKGFTERSHYNYHMKSTHGINHEPIYKTKAKKLLAKLRKNR